MSRVGLRRIAVLGENERPCGFAVESVDERRGLPAGTETGCMRSPSMAILGSPERYGSILRWKAQYGDVVEVAALRKQSSRRHQSSQPFLNVEVKLSRLGGKFTSERIQSVPKDFNFSELAPSSRYSIQPLIPK